MAAYDDLIFRKAQQHGIDPFLVKAIVAAESNFNANASRDEPRIGDKSYGLMQILYGTARWMGYSGAPEGLFDPETNLEFGIRFLQKMLYQFRGNIALAVSAYNTGPGNVAVLPNGQLTNQTYVDRVLTFFRSFRGREAEEPPPQRVTAPPPAVGPSVRAGVQRTARGDLQAVMETVWTPESVPWLVAAGAAVLALILSPRR